MCDNNAKDNKDESITEYCMRRNRIGHYYCTVHKHNHRIDSKIGVKCIDNDVLYKAMTKKIEESENPLDVRFKDNQKNGKKIAKELVMELSGKEFEKVVVEITEEKISGKKENLVRLESGLVLDLDNEWDKRWLERKTK